MFKTQVAVKALIIWDNRILILHKTAEPRDFWVLPGGRINQDEGLEAALKRELKEEIGVTKIKHSRLVYAECVPPNRMRLLNYYCLMLFYEMEADCSKLVLDSEHDSYEWAVVEELLKDEKRTGSELRTAVLKSRYNRKCACPVPTLRPGQFWTCPICGTVHKG
jgi:ADP-ribose pyrophosphatase YjhB (NUDIX family)